jgi:hypothetical protein
MMCHLCHPGCNSYALLGRLGLLDAVRTDAQESVESLQAAIRHVCADAEIYPPLALQRLRYRRQNLRSKTIELRQGIEAVTELERAHKKRPAAARREAEEKRGSLDKLRLYWAKTVGKKMNDRADAESKRAFTDELDNAVSYTFLRSCVVIVRSCVTHMRCVVDRRGGVEAVSQEEEAPARF